MKVSIIMGSISDKEIAQKAVNALKKFDIDYEVKVLSAHRTPDLVIDYVNKIEKEDTQVFIAIAGMAAHLAGVISGLTIKPVIGVPAKGGANDGLDALLSTVQMPSGVPVATVALNGGYNAGVLAAQILATNNEEISEKLREYKKEMVDNVVKMNDEVDF